MKPSPPAAEIAAASSRPDMSLIYAEAIKGALIYGYIY
jgi:hypothetical protein